jgi:hypothetical protein
VINLGPVWNKLFLQVGAACHTGGKRAKTTPYLCYNKTYPVKKEIVDKKEFSKKNGKIKNSRLIQI